MDDSERFIRRVSLQAGLNTMLFCLVTFVAVIAAAGRLSLLPDVTLLAAGLGLLFSGMAWWEWRRVEIRCREIGGEAAEGEPTVVRSLAWRAEAPGSGAGCLVLTPSRLLFRTGGRAAFAFDVAFPITAIAEVRRKFLWNRLAPGIRIRTARHMNHTFLVERVGEWEERIRATQAGLTDGPPDRLG